MEEVHLQEAGREAEEASPSRNRNSILGTVVVVKRMSKTERLIRIKYLGLWRLGSATSHQDQGVTCNKEQTEEKKDTEDRKEERFWQRGDAC